MMTRGEGGNVQQRRYSSWRFVMRHRAAGQPRWVGVRAARRNFWSRTICC